MSGYIMVCPVDAKLSFDTNNRIKCQTNDGLNNNAWEIHSESEYSGLLPDLTVEQGIELGTGFLLIMTLSWVYSRLRRAV